MKLSIGTIGIRANATNKGRVTFDAGNGTLVFKKEISNLKSWFYIVISLGEGKVVSEIQKDIEVFDYFPTETPKDKIILFGD